MQFSVHALLGLLSAERSVAPKILAQKLALAEGEATEQLQLALEALEKVGLVEKAQGRYRLVAREEVVAGRLRCSSKGICFVTPDGPEAEEVFVVEGGLKNAWNGDRVLVQLLKKASRRRKPEGEVVLVTERVNNALVGRLVVGVDGAQQVIPLDDRLGSLLELEEETSPADSGTDQIVEVKITRFPLGRRPARSRLVRVLGSANDPAVDLDLVASRYQLQFGFSEAVLAAAAGPSPAVDPQPAREDLQDLALVAVPGEGPVQFALSLAEQAGGGWELGLHVSDLGRLVGEGSILDVEAHRRVQAVTLRDLKHDLYPPSLIQQAALSETEGRPAWSVLARIDKSGQVQGYRWLPSTVRLSASPKELPQAYLSVAKALSQAGVGPLLPPGDAGIFAELLENLAGQHLAHLHLGAPFLSQSVPEGGELLDWLRLARACGLEVPGTSEAPVALEVSHYRGWLVGETRTENQALRQLLLATLPAEQFSPAPAPHFSRASAAVVPFARPLERYADLLVQRLYAQVLVEGRDRKSPRSKMSVDLRSSSCHGLIDWPVLKPKQQKDWEESLPTLTTHLSTRTQQVCQARADLEGFSRIAALSSQGEPLRGFITGVQSYGFFVAIEEPFVEGLVHVSGLKDDWYTYQAREPSLVGRRSRRRFQIGDSVNVRVKSIDHYRQQVDLMLVRDETEPTVTPAQPGEFESALDDGEPSLVGAEE